mmetsp:Transcript_92000/g.297748  ORF Transcript_92000/g.297748 Transcript_92000/m.297748 type:complete len:202 (-) Transcript_92000:171-776(-)
MQELLLHHEKGPADSRCVRLEPCSNQEAVDAASTLCVSFKPVDWGGPTLVGDAALWVPSDAHDVGGKFDPVPRGWNRQRAKVDLACVRAAPALEVQTPEGVLRVHVKAEVLGLEVGVPIHNVESLQEGLGPVLVGDGADYGASEHVIRRVVLLFILVLLRSRVLLRPREDVERRRGPPEPQEVHPVRLEREAAATNAPSSC